MTKKQKEIIAHLHAADAELRKAMVIAGTSLNVGTPLTFVAMMKEAGKPIIIINKGRTQVDKLADVKLNMNIAEAFGVIASRLMTPVYI
jgi:NAD-dependent SIR2 family protein deacetylase